jgi:hypothetical protein
MQTIFIDVELNEEKIRLPIEVEASWYQDDNGFFPEIMGFSIENEEGFSKEEIAKIFQEAKKQEKKIAQKLLEMSWDVRANSAEFNA